MSEPMFLQGDPIALDNEEDNEQVEKDFWNGVVDAFDDYMGK
jgi:hypothetical protein